MDHFQGLYQWLYGEGIRLQKFSDPADLIEAFKAGWNARRLWSEGKTEPPAKHYEFEPLQEVQR